MQRVAFYAPFGPLTKTEVVDALALVGAEIDVTVTPEDLSPLELLVMFDWAMREHLGASDNRSIRRRRRPSTVRLVP